jgi:hypothetical protein
MGGHGRRLRAAVSLAMLASCAPRSHVPVVAPATGRPAVAVLPFRTGGQLGADAAFTARGDLPPVPDDIGEQMAETLSGALARNGVATVGPSHVMRATPPPGAARYDAALAARVAQGLGVRLAVLGALTRYDEREGSAWGTRNPATVWYQAMLVDAESGAVLDRQRFEYTQQPLSQNLLELPRFLQGGGRWVTRQEMLTGALNETGANLALAIRGAR